MRIESNRQTDLNPDSSLASPITEHVKPDDEDAHLPMQKKQVSDAEQDSLIKSEDAKQIASTNAGWTRKENEDKGVKDYPTLFFASLARQLVRPAAKACVLLLALALLSLGVWSAVNLETEFKVEWLVDMESSFGRSSSMLLASIFSLSSSSFLTISVVFGRWLTQKRAHFPDTGVKGALYIRQCNLILTSHPNSVFIFTGNLTIQQTWTNWRPS